MSIGQEALHLRETNVVLRAHGLETQKGQPLWKCGAVNFKTEVVCLQTLRSHLVFEMDAVMKDLLGQLIAQFLVKEITVHTDVAQDNCHAATVSRRTADVTARRSQSVGRKRPFPATLSHRSSIFACASGHATELMDVAR